jgi:hypothetical protein
MHDELNATAEMFDLMARDFQAASFARPIKRQATEICQQLEGG